MRGHLRLTILFPYWSMSRYKLCRWLYANMSDWSHSRDSYLDQVCEGSRPVIFVPPFTLAARSLEHWQAVKSTTIDHHHQPRLPPPLHIIYLPACKPHFNSPPPSSPKAWPFVTRDYDNHNIPEDSPGTLRSREISELAKRCVVRLVRVIESPRGFLDRLFYYRATHTL